MDQKVYLNRYRLYLDQIGLPIVIRRSAGEATFKAQDLQDHKDVALQVVSVTELRTVVREQLEAEAQTARKITHINIPTLHDFGIEDGQIIYVTEYFDGTAADEWVKGHGPLPVGAVLRVAQQIVNASSVATFHGIIHHAINPANIMLVPGQTNEGEWPLIKLLNIVGVAPNLTLPETRDPHSSDPANFASPEQMQTGSVDFRAQMYSLGATLWFLLTGAAPLEGAAAVEKGGRVPAPVRKLLGQMLDSDPTKRPLDPLALQAAIQNCLAQLERRDSVTTKLGMASVVEKVVSPSSAPQEPVVRERGPMSAKALALAALLVLMAAVAAVVVAQRSGSHEAIGVPIGVPENTAEASPAAIAQAPAPAATQAPVLTAAETDKQTEAAFESSQDSVKTYASNSATNAAPEIAEPAPPAEGPDETSAPPPGRQTAAVAQATPAPVESPAAAPSAAMSKPAVREREESRPVASSSPKRLIKKPSATVSSEMAQPRLPRGRVRAQYLGTTPEGELVFGMPDNAQVYAAPAQPVTRSDRAAARRARHQTRENTEELPVLPALPPDE